MSAVQATFVTIIGRADSGLSYTHRGVPNTTPVSSARRGSIAVLE